MRRIGAIGLAATSARTIGRIQLYRPKTIAQVSEIMEGSEGIPTILAGGTDLCAKINEGLRVQSLIALDAIDELRALKVTGNELWIGSCVTHFDGSSHPHVREKLAGLALAWGKIANVRIRFRATIGGNLMARRPRYEMSALLTALGAKLVFFDHGHQTVRTPEDLWSGMIPDRAFLTHIVIPIAEHFAFFYDRSLRPSMTLALALNETGEGLAGRVALATEYRTPTAIGFSIDRDFVAEKAKTIAQAVMEGLPDSFEDQMTSNWYLRKVGRALLARQLIQVKHA